MVVYHHLSVCPVKLAKNHQFDLFWSTSILKLCSVRLCTIFRQRHMLHMLVVAGTNIKQTSMALRQKQHWPGPTRQTPQWPDENIAAAVTIASQRRWPAQLRLSPTACSSWWILALGLHQHASTGHWRRSATRTFKKSVCAPLRRDIEAQNHVK